MRNEAINASLLTTVSKERLTKYLEATSDDLPRALTLYEVNMRQSEAFYTPLQIVEVSLRNALHRSLSTYCETEFWFHDSSLSLNKQSSQKITDAMNYLKQRKQEFPAGAVVAELKFSFWVGLLGPGYDATVWRDCLYRAFKTKMARDKVHGRFNAIRRFRNRVAHHEPIFTVDLSAQHAEILEATDWICPDTASWATHCSRVPSTLIPAHEHSAP